MSLESHSAHGPGSTETAIGLVHDCQATLGGEQNAQGGPAPTPIGDDGAADINYWQELIGEEVAARFLKLTTRYLQAKRSKGGGPRFIRLSVRCVRYRRIEH